MRRSSESLVSTLPLDLGAGLVVFLVALPLCLGVALASNAPLISGLIAGIVGGVVVGLASGSHTSVSGPAAGLTAVVAAQIHELGSFQTFLLAVTLAGLMQVILGIARAGSIAVFFPTSVIKGLLAAIGVILVLKQIPHVLGHDPDPEGEMAFIQPDRENTLSELLRLTGDIHPGAATIGILSLVLLAAWSRSRWLKHSLMPPPLAVVLMGVVLSLVFRRLGSPWSIEETHLVQVPVARSLSGLADFLATPDWSQWRNPSVLLASVTLCAVASLQSLLNLEAVDKLDPSRRVSPPSRELLAQGLGNLTCGLVGGLPITSVIVRGSVNINASSRSKLSTIVHGLLLAVSVAFLPALLNLIPLSSLAAILLATGIKLASPELVRQMWRAGRDQFAPFLITALAIVLTDLLVGVLIGLAVSIAFILQSNLRRPLRRVVERHLGGEVIHLELATQVSFLNRAALARALNEVPRGGHLLLNAYNTDYIDPDVLDLIRDFKETTGPARGVKVSLLGFRTQYQLDDQTLYVDYSTRELQSRLTPRQVLQILQEGHERFRTGRRLTRDLTRQVHATAQGQHPLAVVLSCIDSRTPAELIFDLGMGDIFSVRIAGNITSRKVIGSIEYACAVAGAKLLVVVGHTRCGAVTTAVDLAASPEKAAKLPCHHVLPIISEIQQSIDPLALDDIVHLAPNEKEAFVNEVARRNVSREVDVLLHQSPALRSLVEEGQLGVVGALYDVVTGGITYLRHVGVDAAPVAHPASENHEPHPPDDLRGPELIADLDPTFTALE
ncbi:MAG: SulP family inorganic anion transporter [Isosphaeraceae bacterium]